jgi:hypothetical protein
VKTNGEEYNCVYPQHDAKISLRELFFRHKVPACERFEVPTAVMMSVLVSWVVTPCGVVGRYLLLDHLELLQGGNIAEMSYKAICRYSPQYQHRY